MVLVSMGVLRARVIVDGRVDISDVGCVDGSVPGIVLGSGDEMVVLILVLNVHGGVD